MLLTWKTALKYFYFRIALALSIAILIGLAFTVDDFLIWQQQRIGKVLNDVVLNKLTPVDLSRLISIVLFSSVIAGIAVCITKPDFLLTVLYTYLIMMALRMVTMYFIPLEPPAGIINIYDPVTNHFFYRNQIINKDLFFSGHTATVLVFAFNAKPVGFKILFFVSSAFIGFCLMKQHVHYTIDVVASYLFTYAAYVAAYMLLNKTGLIKTN